MKRALLSGVSPKASALLTRATLALLVIFLLPASSHASATGCLTDPPRPKPLTSLPVKQTLRVDDFGANGTDQKDDFAAIQSCIDAATSTGAATEIAFTSGGTYILNPAEGGTLHISETANLVFNGNGVSILIKNIRTSFLRIDDSDRVIIRDFQIDYDPLPFTQGIVTAVDQAKDKVTAQLDKGFPSLNMPEFSDRSLHQGNPLQKVIMIRDPKSPGRPKRNTPNSNSAQSWKDLGGGKFEVEVGKGRSRYFAPGDGYVQTARGGRPQVWVEGGSWVTLMNLVIYTSLAAAFHTSASEYAGFVNCQIKIKKGRMQSVVADGVLCAKAAVGPWFENCSIEGNGDDGIVIKGAAAQAIKKVSPTVYQIKGYGGHFAIKLREGDHVSLYDPVKASKLGEVKIASLSLSADKVHTVTLDRALDVPVGTRKTDPVWYDTDLTCGNFVVRNCTIKHARRFAITTMGSNGLIETFATKDYLDETARAVEVRNAANVEVLNNTIEAPRLNSSNAFKVWPDSTENITIKDNTFKETKRALPRRRMSLR